MLTIDTLETNNLTINDLNFQNTDELEDLALDELTMVAGGCCGFVIHINL